MTEDMVSVETKLVSTILRLHDPRRIDRLRLALMSLCGQRHSHIEPIIVLQNFSDADELRVQQAVDQFPWSEATRRAKIINLRGLPAGDHRTKLLNAGLNAATGDFVGFLDYDDYLYPNAYSLLISRIEKSGKPAAFAQLLLSQVDPKSSGGACLSKKLFPTPITRHIFFLENIYPIHSFLIKRELVKNIAVPEHLEVLEDYYFLLSVLNKQDWDDSLVGGSPIGEYVYWTDNSNTVSTSETESEEGKAWRDARECIASYKNDMRIPLSVMLPAVASLGGVQESNLPSVYPRIVLRLLPLISFFKQLNGSFEKVQWDGQLLSVAGEVQVPASKKIDADVGFLFLRRQSTSLSYSYRLLGGIKLSSAKTKDSSVLSFTQSLPLGLRQVRKGRNVLGLFVVDRKGKLYPTTAVGRANPT